MKNNMKDFFTTIFDSIPWIENQKNAFSVMVFDLSCNLCFTGSFFKNIQALFETIVSESPHDFE